VWPRHAPANCSTFVSATYGTSLCHVARSEYHAFGTFAYDHWGDSGRACGVQATRQQHVFAETTYHPIHQRGTGAIKSIVARAISLVMRNEPGIGAETRPFREQS